MMSTGCCAWNMRPVGMEWHERTLSSSFGVGCDRRNLEQCHPRLPGAVRRGDADLARLGMSGFHAGLQPVYATLQRLKQKLPAETALIGFAGAPWTVASYMVEGGSSRDFAKTKAWAYAAPESFQ